MALAQTERVIGRLTQVHPDLDVQVQVIKTKGDIEKDQPLEKIGGNGLFVKEIERELLEGRIDFAVHSLKDVPPKLPEGLVIAAVPERADHRDVMVANSGRGVWEKSDIDSERVVATGSIRRKVQLQKLYPNCRFAEIRGNIETRIQKMYDQELDALILAAAGLERLGLQGAITRRFDVEEMVPSPAQGALGVEARESDERITGILRAISNSELEREVDWERSFLLHSDCDCHAPVGAFCRGNKFWAFLGDTGSGIMRYRFQECRSKDDVVRMAKEMRDEVGYGR